MHFSYSFRTIFAHFSYAFCTLSIHFSHPFCMCEKRMESVWKVYEKCMKSALCAHLAGFSRTFNTLFVHFLYTFRDSVGMCTVFADFTSSVVLLYHTSGRRLFPPNRTDEKCMKSVRKVYNGDVCSFGYVCSDNFL